MTTRTITTGRLLAGLGLAMLALGGCSKEEPASNNTTPAPTKMADKGGDKPAPDANGKKKILFVFKVGGISYSTACKAGADEANEDASLNAQVDYQASTEGTAEKQNEIIEQAIVSKVDAIVVSPVDANAIVPVLNKATDAGIKVFTWDADAPTSKRLFYFAAVDDVQIGSDVADALANSIDAKGKVLLVSGHQTAENLNMHVKGMEAGFKKYPNIKVVTPTIYNDDDLQQAKSKTLTALQADPDVVGIACANSVSPHGAGEAVKTAGKIGKIKVWGLGLPSENKPYLMDGSVTGLYLWDPKQLTYVTAKMVRAALDGKMPADGGTIDGVEGKTQVKGQIVTLPLRLEINKDNVDKMTF